MGVAIKVNKVGGTQVYVNGELQGNNRLDLFNSVLPYPFYSGCAVVFNNEIHILGGGSSLPNNKHYKWNGSEWASVSTLPINLREGCAVVFDNAIHIFDSTSHYKWDGTSWTSVSTLPHNIDGGCVVVYNNEIHMLSGASGYADKHYKWNGTSWVSVSTIYTDKFRTGCAVVYDNCIYILKNDGSTNVFGKWDGTTWTNLIISNASAKVPYVFINGSAVVKDNKIIILGSSYNTTGGGSYSCEWDGEAWGDRKHLPVGLDKGCAVVWNNDIYYMCGACAQQTMAKYNSTIYFS